jgi:hypothetical protein
MRPTRSLFLPVLAILAAVIAPALNPTAVQGNDPAAVLQTIPVLPTLTTHVRDIFAQGQQMGSRANVFTQVGDCNSDTRAFLFPFDRGEYDLGPYASLEETVRFFTGSFARDSAAGQFGYSALSVLDPLFADPQVCQRGESSVACEYRRSQPAVALIMFGANDVVGLTEEQYAASIGQIVATSLDRGIIPVLSTFPWCANDWQYEKALRLNVITVQVAREYDVPLVNFWRAAQTLPNCGYAPDTHHLSQAGPRGYAPFVAFNGEEARSGNTLRNLLTLQILDLLRREVLAAEE